ncbi:P-loop containing nucleoside triphosphate hydrolase protein [Sphaerosporella brunnea]|uniref:P-loop containing nucleoside triphosphate hydrolase protein n=1 Tax=Sphaerosporella brunnea TaxID=1250544 RepID=A0A5J5F1K6_9PEZI|nr:P-loop containing nucleoside triphosphate hydrolase protein [Sphaerosporella brunnea]
MQPSRREYNIVVLGAGGVGKSCLTAQFVQNVWIESYDPTIEDSYRKVVDVDGKSCILEILDTAGTEQFKIYLKTGKYCLPYRLILEALLINGFLLVYSITSLTSFQELTPIRDAILRIKEVDDVPLVIVGNKSDLEGDRQVSKNRANHLSRKWGNVPLYESSARRRQNVDEVFFNLTRQLMKKHSGDGGAGAGSGGTAGGGRRKKGKSCIIL